MRKDNHKMAVKALLWIIAAMSDIELYSRSLIYAALCEVELSVALL